VIVQRLKSERHPLLLKHCRRRLEELLLLLLVPRIHPLIWIGSVNVSLLIHFLKVDTSFEVL
jgi:hypothetical protein